MGKEAAAGGPATVPALAAKVVRWKTLRSAATTGNNSAL